MEPGRNGDIELHKGGIRTLLCVLVLVVEAVVVLPRVCVWMVPTLWVVVGVLAVVTMMVQKFGRSCFWVE